MDGHAVGSQVNHVQHQICKHKTCQTLGLGRNTLNNQNKPQTVNVKVNVSAKENMHSGNLPCSASPKSCLNNLNRRKDNQSTASPENKTFENQSTISTENRHRDVKQSRVNSDEEQQEGMGTTNNPPSQPTTFETKDSSSSANVCANFTAYMTKNTVNVSVNDRKSNALCDTGASVSCISKQFFDKAFPAHKPNINPCNIKSIVGVGGTHHPVLGVVIVNVKFGTLGLSYPFYVVEDLHHSLILGHDFMEAHNVTLDIKGKKMLIQDQVKVCSLRTNTGYARTVKPIKLPANSEIDIPVKIARVSTNEEVLLEPFSRLANESILGAKCLVRVNKGKSVMRLVNLSESDIYLRGNKVLAVVSQVEKANIFTLNDSEISHTNTTEQNHCTEKPVHKFSFDLQNADLNEQQKEKLLSFLHANSDIFSEGLHDLGKTHLVTHHVDTGDAPPVKLPPYKQTPEMRRITHQYVEDYKQNNLIKESNSNWHSPVVLVKKANSDEFRFAVDYRKLNKISKSQAYPIPRLSDIFDAIGEANAHFFTSLDLGKAFWQVPLSEESKSRTAFITYDGIFEFQTMPFGLQGAPATFQHLMMKVLRGISWKYVLCYVDDVIIFSATFDDHLQHLEEVFRRLRNAGLKLSPNKCYFAQKKLHYLGHVISKSGIETDPKKVEKIQNLRAPKDQKGVKSLLGLTNYYKKFIAGYSKLCSPLFDLLKKGTPFVWSEECEKALTSLKHAMTSSPILAFPDMNKPFFLTCDASRSGLGFILGQEDENKKERVIEFGGRALHGAEKNYSVSELECLAIVEGVKAYKAYLSTGIPFTIITDHKALTCLNSLTNSQNGRLARWALFLQGFRYKVVYRKGEENNADALSRLTKEAQEGTSSEQNYVLVDTFLTDLESSTEVRNNTSCCHSNSSKQSNSTDPVKKASISSPNNQIPKINTNAIDTNRHLPQSSNNKEWLELKFDFNVKADVSSLEANQSTETIAEAPDDLSDLISMQKQCSDFKDIYNYLANNDIPEDEKLRKTVLFEKEHYDLLDGVLMHRFQPRSKKKPTNEQFTFQIALPKQMRLKALQDYHDNNGHFGYKKVYSAIQTKYYWPRMFQQIYDYVKSCDRCQRTKREAHPNTTPLNPLPVAKVFERLHIDLIGPLPKTTAGHEYILVCVDSFSRWVEAFPLHDQTASTIARVLHDEIFCRFGSPINIVSDRGRNFLSKLCNAVCEIYKVSRHMTASYNPRANGCVERQNATIAQTLRAYINKDQNNWHLLLPTVLMSIRSAPNTETSGYSPFKMLFGNEMRLPFDTTLVPKETLGPEAKIHVTNLIDRLKLVHEQATTNSQLSQAESKQAHDAKAKESNFLLGEQVLLKIHKTRPGYAKKLEDKFSGPFYIREKGPFDTYKVADCRDNKVVKNFINAQDLKRYYDPQNYRYEPPDDDLFETESNADTVIYDPNENEPNNSQQLNANENTDKEQKKDERHEINEQKPKTDAWYSVNKIIKQRQVGQKKQFLLEWSDVRFKPSWQDEENVSEELKRQFYIRHTRTGKKRKRPYKCFN